MRLGLLCRGITGEVQAIIRLLELGHLAIYEPMLFKSLSSVPDGLRVSAFFSNTQLEKESQTGDLKKVVGRLPLDRLHSVILDVGMGNQLATVARFGAALLSAEPRLPIGIMANQSLALGSARELAKYFQSANYFPISVVGNGLDPLESGLQALREVYQNAVPCVLSITPRETGVLGDILLKHWKDFSELMFFSPLTLVQTELVMVREKLAPVRLLETQMYKAVVSTHIRKAPSLNTELKGRTVEGQSYRLVAFVDEGNVTFARLEDGTFVVFKDAQTYFRQETL